MFLKHLDKNNLHHAYLIEGVRDEVILELGHFLKEIEFNTIGNPDFINISLDSFKVDDARNLKSLGSQKGFTVGKKIFIISANSFLLEAQNSLLKMFEEPIENTHFFLITPDTNSLLKTFVSRFYLISTKSGQIEENTTDTEKFIRMSLRDRIEFIKELLLEEDDEDEDGNEIIVLNSTRAKAIKFLNTLEFVLQKNLIKNSAIFPHLFKVREFLRMPGSSTKTLLESVALVTPTI